MSSPPLSLADEAYVLLRHRLTRCEIQPGSRFTAREAADHLGLGLTPVREALMQLDRERLVVTVPRRGYLATPLTATTVGNVLATWHIVEPQVAALAARGAGSGAPPAEPAPLDVPAADPADPGAAAAEARSRQRLALAARTGNALLGDVVRFLDGQLLRLDVRAVARLGPAAAAGTGTRQLTALLDRLVDPDPGPATTPGRPSPAARAYCRVRADIVRGTLAPGTRLTERTLSARLGVGLTPVREALHRLDHERLVATVPRRGYVVTRISARDVADAAELWSMLVTDMLQLAVRHATPEQAEAVVAAVRAPSSEDDDPGLVVGRSAGWRLMAQATGNDVLAAVFELLDGILARSIAEQLAADPTPVAVTAQKWTELFARRDAGFARELAAGYIAWVSTRALGAAAQEA